MRAERLRASASRSALLLSAAGALAAGALAAGSGSPRPAVTQIDAQALTMLALERETLANELAAYVANALARSKDSQRALWSQRILGLALCLHPQNPRALATDRALKQRAALPALESEQSPAVFARLLYHRAKSLEKAKETDRIVAPYFMAIAAYIRPSFEDAVYESEKRRLRDGALNWAPVSGQDFAKTQR